MKVNYGMFVYWRDQAANTNLKLWRILSPLIEVNEINEFSLFRFLLPCLNQRGQQSGFIKADGFSSKLSIDLAVSRIRSYGWMWCGERTNFLHKEDNFWVHGEPDFTNTIQRRSATLWVWKVQSFGRTSAYHPNGRLPWERFRCV